MKILAKIILAIDYLFYTYFIATVPFHPGTLVRRLYFRLRCGKSFGKNVSVGGNVMIGSPRLLEIKDNVSISGQVIFGYAIGGKIILEEGSLIGHGVFFVNLMHEYKDTKMRIQDQGYRMPYEDIRIGKNVWIGAGCIIMPGVDIGDYSIVGAGAVVTHSIPRFSIAVGVPARVIKRR